IHIRATALLKFTESRALDDLRQRSAQDSEPGHRARGPNCAPQWRHRSPRGVMTSGLESARRDGYLTLRCTSTVKIRASLRIASTTAWQPTSGPDPVRSTMMTEALSRSCLRKLSR